jgi:hypothetical protein
VGVGGNVGTGPPQSPWLQHDIPEQVFETEKPKNGDQGNVVDS